MVQIMKKLLLPLVLVAAAIPAAAQEIEDPGPYLVGWRDVSFQDVIFNQGVISGRIYYPGLTAERNADADSSGGPYPLVAHQHGWLGRASYYDDLCGHLASWGFVVVSTGTESGLFPNHAQFARDTRSFLHWADTESANPSSWLAGMTWDGIWGASGHSMGGGVLHRLIGIEPRVQVIIGLQAASQSGSTATTNINNYTGAAFYIAGEVDSIVPPATVREWYLEADIAPRSFYFEVLGMGHNGCLDFPPDNEPLPGAEQHRIHRLLVAGLYRAEMLQEEDLYIEILGEGIASEPVIYESDCSVPPLWAEESGQAPGNLAVGIAGAPGMRGLTAWSLVPDNQQSPYGLIEIDVNAATIVADEVLSGPAAIEDLVPIQGSWSGQTVYIQGLVVGGGSGQVSRMVAIDFP